ncbi:hypothetical protein BCR33DRAFT_711773 [Rhizoclosmatium globosum]|uniref:Zn(2)-C6 fungal-type domain-containing protein n=1 Tax=Rhizoclosmatium globosum TaxID=329046 RepID=A0A1Y2CZP0_9FUNG|nr:hypothetical protein BCR33DRAFT_711773 [Rhizoclosmatium globosum]|eukprot:ORY52460.1 hypothetical protein BCR33DRAFT_711773 [Rhizoclosmatium globosum]
MDNPDSHLSFHQTEESSINGQELVYLPPPLDLQPNPVNLNLYPNPTAETSYRSLPRHPRSFPCKSCRSQRKKCDGVSSGCSRCLEQGTLCEYEDSPRRFHRQGPPLTTEEPNSSQLPSLPPFDYFSLQYEAKYNPETSSSVSPPPPPYPPQLSNYAAQSSVRRNLSHGIASAAELADTDLTALAQRYQNEIASLTKRPLPCDVCRQQKKKCDRLRPSCSSCLQRNIKCEYVLPPKKASQAKWRARLVLENAQSLGSVQLPEPIQQIDRGFTLAPFAVPPQILMEGDGRNVASTFRPPPLQTTLIPPSLFTNPGSLSLSPIGSPSPLPPIRFASAPTSSINSEIAAVEPVHQPSGSTSSSRSSVMSVNSLLL